MMKIVEQWQNGFVSQCKRAMENVLVFLRRYGDEKNSVP